MARTTTAPRAAITVDPWDPGYATSLTAEALGELDAGSRRQLDLGVELPADRWRPVTPAAAGLPPGGLIVADGVRRVEARVWVADPDGGMPAPGIAASCAAGLVRCRPGRPAELAEVDVRRSLFTPSPHAADVATWAGTYQAEKAQGGTAEQLSLALQRRLTDVEVGLATRYRTESGHDDDLLIVDGPLRGRAHLPRTVGYVKTHHAAYLTGAQASVLAALRPGQRTPVFLMTTSWARHSWYLRLPTPSDAPWAGVARCEAAPDLPRKAVAELADQSAAIIPALAGVDYKDPRAPQNLVPIGGLEKVLRHRLGDAGLLYRALRTVAQG
ncbi:hypothetical protein [Actinomadura chibensis]|uniref:NurA domain-containing protein n=1 Tax=Actinomadura chibensis TaxID=392828 RepID=A0A5D0NDW8_9ACTN|nr:hypothetical protein [Actinomadura chibensis]TYB42523.1 hypothetical protein FXF69_32545 [Actinomadura chibensis]